MKKYLVASAAFIFVQSLALAQGLYDLNTVQRIDLYFSQSDWDYQLDTLKSGSDGYLLCDSVKVNGFMMPSVGVKYKGNSSYDATYTKNPIHISLDEFVNQTYYGVTSIKLGNGYSDPSLIREVLSYTILSNYMDCPRANFARLYINDQYVGLYSNVEAIDKTFCSNHFYSSDGTFIKCNPLLNPSPSTKSNLKYINADSTSYFNYYEVKSNNGWNDLVDLCDSVSAGNISTPIDIDRLIWMLAFDNVLVNLDSYMGVFCQNYYLYKDHTNRYNPIVWDLNMSFGGFPYLGSGNSSMAQLTSANMEQLPMNVHSTDVYWPLIKAIQANAQYKRMYIAHIKTITNEFFANDAFSALASQMQTLIDNAVLEDSNKFYTYDNFLAAMNTEVSVGSYNVPGIATLMNARNNYLQGTTEFGYDAPQISNINSSINPAPGDNFYLRCTVSNATSVYFGFRTVNTNKFIRTTMFDDGNHDDGSAGDGVYGILLNMTTASIQYYIYAENAQAGTFSPARAEFEYYTLLANIQSPVAGDIVINEFLAQNVTGVTDEAGEHEDWIELYNSSSENISLNGLFISDDYGNPFKYAFSASDYIPAHSWLTLWADQDISTTSIHLNFKLGFGGEEIMLSAADGTVLDSISFGLQTADVSMGRCPDGTGEFASMSPTYGYNNCPISVQELESNFFYDLYPNPCSEQFCIRSMDIPRPQTVRIYNAMGQVIYQNQLTQGKIEIDTTSWSGGLYTVSLGGFNRKVSVVH